MHVMSKFLNGLRSRASSAALRFANDKSGVAAVEFVFIAPLIITLWLGTMEISQGIEINKKVGRSASMIGDIITQTEAMNVTDVDDVLKIGAAVLQPYQRDKPTITVAEIYVSASSVAKIVWSRKNAKGVFSAGPAANTVVTTTLPPNLLIPDTYLIKSETSLEYLPVTSWSIRKNKTGPQGSYASVNMHEVYYLRPRQGVSVNCVGC
jgi:Flp pilus assembly protein TadG